MHGEKLLVCNLIMSLIIFNVVAPDVHNEGDDDDELYDEFDDEFDNEFYIYKENLLNAMETLSKNLNILDVRVMELNRRGWLRNLWNKVVKPVLVNAAVKVVEGAVGKRIFDGSGTLKPEARASNSTECVKNAATFKEVKKAASQLCDSQLCALAKIPEIKCFIKSELENKIKLK